MQPTGHKAFAIRYRFPKRKPNKPKKLTLEPPWPALSLATARKAEAEALHQLAQGRDPGALKFEAETAEKKAAAERAADTVDHWAKNFIERHAKKKTRENSWRQAVYVFDRIVLPEWSGRVIHDLKRRDVRELVENVAEDRPIMANRALAHLSKFFNWLCEQDAIAASPCAGVKRPASEQARERTLSERELVELWHACDAMCEPARSWIRMLVLLGQRRSETAGMRRSELNGDLWQLPATRMKGREPHTLPLPAQAMAIVEALPQIGDGDLVFTSDGLSPLSNFGLVKRLIDAEMKPIAPWTWHDIRRSTASALAGLGIPVPVIEKILAHRSGTFRGIVSTYQRHSFIPEMRAALERWSEHLDRLVRGVPATKVIPIGRR